MFAPDEYDGAELIIKEGATPSKATRKITVTFNNLGGFTFLDDIGVITLDSGNT